MTASDATRSPFPEWSRVAERVAALTVDSDAVTEREEWLVGEEPLEIRACGPGQDRIDVAVTMRTPSHEDELAAGFLLSEGLATAADLARATFEPGDPGRMAQPENEIAVHLPVTFDAGRVAARAFVATASCGICGKASIDDVALRCGRLAPGPTVARSVLTGLPDTMRSAQEVFSSTGGLHAAGLFTAAGRLVALREDVGRHNALDKVIGASVFAGEVPASERVLLVSGRVSFELVQKAAMAGIPVICAVSAPSSLAVATAERVGMTLLGFLRGERFNIYTGRERIDLGG